MLILERGETSLELIEVEGKRLLTSITGGDKCNASQKGGNFLKKNEGNLQI